MESYSWQYDLAGNVKQMTSTKDGTTTYTYYDNNELESATNNSDSSALDESYAYDASGNRQTATTDGGTAQNCQSKDNEVTFDGTYHYTYDKNGEAHREVQDRGPADDPIHPGPHLRHGHNDLHLGLSGPLDQRDDRAELRGYYAGRHLHL